jgi:hypothetical protein
MSTSPLFEPGNHKFNLWEYPMVAATPPECRVYVEDSIAELNRLFLFIILGTMVLVVIVALILARESHKYFYQAMRELLEATPEEREESLRRRCPEVDVEVSKRENGGNEKGDGFWGLEKRRLATRPVELV